MLFHYAKTRRRQALKIAFNILLIPVLLFAFHHFFQDKANFSEIYDIAVKAGMAVMVVLTGIFLWFLKSKEKFEIYVTANEFYSYHPIFKEWCFSVNPKDIVEIEHHLRIDTSAMTNINVYLKDGTKVQICQNYPFSRKKLYSALEQANAEIQFPDNPNVFKHRKTEAMDQYVSNRFPLTTKVVKSALKVMPGQNVESAAGKQDKRQ
ncbi:hypothetical protein [Marinobacter sp. MDS2]|nr:hypothetical protein [Marinobacter sp. MDS2]MDP4547224.1 hypothetical protein [Marinobacter sp. MDS2]